MKSLACLVFVLFGGAAVFGETKLSLAPQTAGTPLEPLEITVPAGEKILISFPILSGNLWLKDGLAIPDAAGQTLTIDSARLEDAGTYRVSYAGIQPLDSQELVLRVAEDTSAPSTPRILAFTSRGVAGSGSQALVTGFALDEVPGAPDATKTLLVRAVGPTLAAFDVAGVLAHPQLGVFDSNGRRCVPVSTAPSALREAELATGAYPVGDADAAQLLRLSPGVYTVQVTSGSGPAGLVLLEVYEVPE